MQDILQITIAVKDLASKAIQEIKRTSQAYDQTLRSLNGTVNSLQSSIARLAAALGEVNLFRGFLGTAAD